MNRFLVWDHESLPREARRLRKAAMMSVAVLLAPAGDDGVVVGECHAGAPFVCAAHPDRRLLCRRCADRHVRDHESICAACGGSIATGALAPARRLGIALAPVTVRVARPGAIVSEPHALTVVCELHQSCEAHLFAEFAFERALPEPPGGGPA